MRIKGLIIYCTYIILITFILLEVLLRIYNPFHFRLKYDQIILPVNQQQVISNSINDKLDHKIINTRNALGFRGQEKPDSFDKYLSLITVGGSTTECHFLSDEKTWPDLLGQKLHKEFNSFWLNNAGFDGHSTFGHQVLLNDYLVRIKPKVILFLVGINDVESSQPSFHDKLNIKGAYPDFKHFVFTNSEVLSLGLNLVRGWRSQKLNNTTHKPIDLVNYELLEVPNSVKARKLREQEPYLISYKTRISQLIDSCHANGILPVFMTQPNLLGKGTDDVTAVDLERFKVGDEMNGALLWQLLTLYNELVIRTCKEKKVPYLDLANLMPKSSLFFYDISHYTNEGAEKVAAVVAPELKKILKTYFPDYYRGSE